MRVRTHGLLMLAIVALVVAGALPASAAPVPNDSESGAVEITSLPFTYEQDTAGATASGPRFCGNDGSVFFSFTPNKDVKTQIDTVGSDYVTVLSVYTREGKGGRIACSAYTFGDQAGVRFNAEAKTTYIVMVAFCCGNSGDEGGGHLVLHAEGVEKIALEASATVGSGTVDAGTGIATLSGTLTCNEVAWVEVYGMLREVRGMFVARGFFDWSFACSPGDPVSWQVEVDTETGVLFTSGEAALVYGFSAGDGFRDYIEGPTKNTSIQLTSS